jgi:hypothetical protein
MLYHPIQHECLLPEIRLALNSLVSGMHVTPLTSEIPQDERQTSFPALPFRFKHR